MDVALSQLQILYERQIFLEDQASLSIPNTSVKSKNKKNQYFFHEISIFVFLPLH